MINDVINILTNELNSYLHPKTGIENLVVQESLVTQSGSLSPNINSKVVLSVVNMEEDRISRSLDIRRKQVNGSIDRTKQEIRFNLYILLAAHFPSSNSSNIYNVGLKALSGVVSFFQSKNVFTQKNTAGLPDAIDKLLVEHYSLSFEQQNHLWGALGAKYLPSVMYKIRLIVFQEEPITLGGPPIMNVDIKTKDSNL